MSPKDVLFYVLRSNSGPHIMLVTSLLSCLQSIIASLYIYMYKLGERVMFFYSLDILKSIDQYSIESPLTWICLLFTNFFIEVRHFLTRI